jgi:hypothetical protein
MILLVVVSLLAAGMVLGLSASTYKAILLPLAWILFVGTSVPVVIRWIATVSRPKSPPPARPWRHRRITDSVSGLQHVPDAMFPTQSKY